MWNFHATWTNDPDVKGHVPIVTLYAIIMFIGHFVSYSEWTLGCNGANKFVFTLRTPCRQVENICIECFDILVFI